jgi:tight adherence protein C
VSGVLDPRLILGAIACAGAVGLATTALYKPPRKLAGRLLPYTMIARTRLGTGQPQTELLEAAAHERSGVAEVFGPIVRRLAEALGGVIDAGGREATELRLRHAGMSDLSVDGYRARQLGATVAAVSGGLIVGLATASGAVVTLLCGALMVFPGASFWRNRVTAAIETRRAAMRVETYTLAQLLAVHLRTGEGGIGKAVRSVVGRSSGPVSDELWEASAWIEAGVPPQEAYASLARLCAEPDTARFYRILAAGHRGGDIAPALLSLATGIRADRREDIARTAVRKRTAMVIPLVVVIAPVMILFVAAPLPSLLNLGN